MAISVYDPDAKTWVTSGVVGDPGSKGLGLLLTNILIELRLHTQYLAAMNTGIVLDDPQTLRVDEAQSWPVNG